MKAREKRLERLVDAQPRWVDSHEGRKGIAVWFLCPIHEECDVYVPMTPALDGSPSVDGAGQLHWQRTGDTFETLTLSPSIKVMGDRKGDGCMWHGFVKNGRFEHCGDSR